MTMAVDSTIRIPSGHQPAFQLLGGMTQEQRERLASSLASLRPSQFLGPSSDRLATELGLDHQVAGRLLAMLASLFNLRDQTELSRPLEDEIAAALKADKELDLSEEAIEGVRLFLSKALALDATLGVTSKAWSMVREFERTFCYARLMTDLRPVFTRTEPLEPAALVLAHNLKIAYHEGDQIKEFYVSLTGADVETLQGILERAAAKQKSLASLAQKVNLPVLEEE